MSLEEIVPIAIFAFLVVVGIAIPAVIFIREKLDQQACRGVSNPSHYGSSKACGHKYNSIRGYQLEKVVAKRNYFSYNGNEYDVTFYFKCDKCGSTREYGFKTKIEYSIDLLENVRNIADREWPRRVSVPHYKLEVEE